MFSIVADHPLFNARRERRIAPAAATCWCWAIYPARLPPSGGLISYGASIMYSFAKPRRRTQGQQGLGPSAGAPATRF